MPSLRSQQINYLTNIQKLCKIVYKLIHFRINCEKKQNMIPI